MSKSRTSTPAYDHEAVMARKRESALVNPIIAAALRERGLPTSGRVWALAKAHVAKGGLLTPAYLDTLAGTKTAAKQAAKIDADAQARAAKREAKRAANRKAHAEAQAQREAARKAAK